MNCSTSLGGLLTDFRHDDEEREQARDHSRHRVAPRYRRRDRQFWKQLCLFETRAGGVGGVRTDFETAELKHRRLQRIAARRTRRPHVPEEASREMIRAGCWTESRMRAAMPTVDARNCCWGLRGTRIGEASNPGPPGEGVVQSDSFADAAPVSPRTPDRRIRSTSWHSPEGFLSGEVAPTAPEAVTPLSELRRHHVSGPEPGPSQLWPPIWRSRTRDRQI